MTVNKLILGDNLQILKSMKAGSVDLICLDSPTAESETAQKFYQTP
jgi:DNA modification methylase